MYNLDIETIEKLHSNIAKIEQIKSFKYSKEFLKLWHKRLLETANTQTFFISKFKDKSQCYEGTFNFYGVDISLTFNIEYMLSMLSKNDNRLFTKIVLDNDKGNLSYFSDKCIYTFYEENEIKEHYENYENILVVPIPIVPTQYIIVDGNHRVCKQIYDNKKTIEAYYSSEIISALSLIKPIQISVYCFLFDTAKIIYNYGKVKDGWIRNELNIFNHNSAFYFSLNRKRINSSI